MNRSYGVPGFRPYRSEPTFKVAAPTTVDHVDRKTLNVPIRDQLQEGSCTGFGWGRTIQGVLGGESFSPQFLYFIARLQRGWEGLDSGAFVGDVWDAVIKYGVAHESVYPYVEGQYEVRPTYEAFQDAMLVKQKLKALRVFGSQGVKSALAQPNTMIVFGFSVPEYFESQQMDDTGWLKLPGSSDRFIGGHCVACDGFVTHDNSVPEPYLWCPNSWGSGWGPFGGWFKMPLRWIDDSRRLVDEIYAVSPA